MRKPRKRALTGANNFARKPFANIFLAKQAMKSGCQAPKMGRTWRSMPVNRRGTHSRSSEQGIDDISVCYTVFGIAFNCSADALLKALKRMQKNFCKSLSRKSCFQKGAPISAAHRNCSPLSGSIALLHSISSYIAALGFTLVLRCRAIRFVRLFTSTLA